MISGQNLIGFQKSGKGNKTFKTFNPQLNDKNPWTFIEATVEEIEKACQLAAEAFPMFRKTSWEQRKSFISSVCNKLEAHKQELIQVFCQESGLSEERASIELDRTLFQLENYMASAEATVASNSYDDIIDGRILKNTLIPLGPIAVFGASNFPFAYSTAGGDTASALVAGCPVIVKSHPWHAGTGELVGEIVNAAAKESEMPEGIFSNLNSSDRFVGQQLVLNPNVKGVGFTGSIRGGRALMDLAASREEPIPVFAEMGSTNPIFISNKSLEKDSLKWAIKLADSMKQGNGQYCTSPGLIFAQKSKEFDQFKKQIGDQLNEFDNEVMLHPQIGENFNLGIKEIENGESAQVLLSGRTQNNNVAEPGLVSVSSADFLSNPSYYQEVFGPFAIFVDLNSPEEMYQIIESLHGQLTASILFDEDENIARLKELLMYKVGRLVLNGVPTGVSVSKAMHHGGPYPASSDPRFTAVGSNAIMRWLRPVTIQESSS